MYLIIMERICRITKMYARREFHIVNGIVLTSIVFVRTNLSIVHMKTA